MNMYFNAANGLKGNRDLGVDGRELELYIRHLSFAYFLKICKNKVENRPRHCIVSGVNAAWYCRIVSCLNQKAVMKKGFYGMRYHTTWKTFTVDAAAYMRDQDVKEQEWNRTLFPVQMALNAALDCGGERLLDNENLFESIPLCVVLGMKMENAALLIIYKEFGVWMAMIKSCGEGNNDQVPFIAKLILRKLKIVHVKIIPDLGVQGEDSDPTKEAFKNVGKLFDGGLDFQIWKEI